MTRKTTISREGLEFLIGAVKNTINIGDIINNEDLADNKTYSNIKIEERIDDKIDEKLADFTGGGGGSSEEQIKDWVNGSSYLEGDYIYHEGELYRCLASNNDVDFDETNWEQLTYGIDELSKEDVERLLGLTKEEIEAMADLILDTEVRIDKTYSSSKIYTDIQQCLEDSKAYTLEEIARASTASYKVVTDVVDMTEERYLYLLYNENTNYDIYIVETDGTPTKIGDAQIDLSNYYTKTEIDNDFLKKVDADSKYATITTVDGKIDKDKIVTALDGTVTDEQVPSARIVVDELGLKANDSEVVKKTDIATTIDLSSTDNQVPSAKAVYDAIQAGGGNGNVNIVTSLSSASTDTQVPSSKCVYDKLKDLEALINSGGGGGNGVQLNKIIFIDQESDYDPRDISVVLNRLIPIIDEGDVLYLKAEKVFLDNTVTGTLPRGATLYLDASISLLQPIDAFSLSLGVYGGGKLYIKELSNFLVDNYASHSNAGLTLYETYNAEITFDIIQGFRYGLYLDGGKSENGYKGIQYNKIHFLNMNRCNIDIYLNAKNNTGWVNDNTFTGGRIMGKVGIVTAPIGNADVYNNNKFYNIGFEGVTGSLIQFNNARYNCVMNPRILEDFPNGTWVYEDEYCIANQYHISHPVPENKFELGWHSEVHAQLLYGDSWDFNLVMSRRMYVEYSIGCNENVKMYDDIAHKLHIDDTTFANSGNKYHVRQKTNIYVKLYNSSSSATRYLIIDNCFNYHGCTFDVYVTNASGNYLSFGYYNSSGSIVLGTNKVGNGVYRLTNYEGLWVFSKISEEFKMI